jgi:hypothetical protein
MKSTGWVLGYHGCDANLGEAVLRGEKSLAPSSNDYDWLGTGIYFWEANPTRALNWAESVQSNAKLSKTEIRNPFALGAIIDLGHCLDLMESDSIKILKQAYSDYEALFTKYGLTLPQNSGASLDRGQRKLDCAVVNFMHDLREQEGEKPFDSVRALFPEGEELYPAAGFRDKTHIQLSVRNESKIIAYFRPRFDRL